MNTLKRFFVVLAVGCLFSVPANIQAQEDFDKMFEEMMREFFPKDLIEEIDEIREDDAKGTKNFYKNDPRFLAIKERQIKQRRKDLVEKQHPSNLHIFKPLAQKYSKSTIGLFDGDNKDRLALATAVSKTGLMVTKASELNDLDNLTCKTSSGNVFQAKVVKVDKTHDLALLKTEKTLTPIKFEESPLDEGTILVSVENSTQPLAMGTLAVKPRSIIGNNRGFLGVEPGPNAAGVMIKSVTRGSAANRAGVQAGDVVKSINMVPTRTVAELVREIGSKKKGEKVLLAIVRDGSARKIEATLDGRMMRGERAARFEMMRRLGTILSKRHDEFPSVMQHDTPILPHECGGPVVDLDGKVLGINIARAGRTSTYALPMEIVKRFVDSFKS